MPSVNRRLIGYGAMQLSGAGAWGPPPDPAGAVRLLRLAYEWGVRLIDTAWYYGPYVTNQLVAAALHPYAEDLVLVTKAGNSRGPDRSWVPALGADDLRRACHTDLSLLRLETLPLVLLRWQPRPNDGHAFLEALDVLLTLQREGKVASVGLSNVSVRHLEAALLVTPIAAVSNAFSVMNRRDTEVLTMCTDAGVRFLPYYPLLGGEVVRRPVLQRKARQLGLKPAQLAIAWLCAQSPMVVPVPGTASLRHLHDNTEAQSLVLDRETVEALDEELRTGLSG